MSNFTPSPNQSAILTAVLSTSDNICINAVAGSGKTTTIVWLVAQLPLRPAGQLLPSSILFLAFNKNIAEELQTRIGTRAACRTFHSLGLSALKNSGLKPKVDGRKVGRLVYPHLSRDNPDALGIIRLVGLLKSAIGLDPQDIIRSHNLSFEDPALAADVASKALAQSDSDTDTIDFDDMLRLPVLLDLPFDQQDYVFVDEAQDLNAIQHDILTRLAKQRWPIGSAGTRYIMVGDPHQSIYGFRGAASDSMDLLSSRFGARTLPLDICYRCSTSIVAEAQRVAQLNW